MEKKSLVLAFMGSILFWCCQNDDNGLPQPPQFSITGNTANGTATYGQTVFDGGSNGNINVFDRTDRSLYLQTFKNGKDDLEGFWTIRINGLDIENLSTPYALTGVEGSITWVDESVKPLQQPCSAADVLCFYSGVGVDEVTITITEVEDGVISGTFKGSLYHIRVNPSVIRDTGDLVEVTEGSFSMRFTSR
ncbi:MAG: hypothetical protein AAFX53_13185 [Bacteroidota bacterium]